MSATQTGVLGFESWFGFQFQLPVTVVFWETASDDGSPWSRMGDQVEIQDPAQAWPSPGCCEYSVSEPVGKSLLLSQSVSASLSFNRRKETAGVCSHVPLLLKQLIPPTWPHLIPITTQSPRYIHLAIMLATTTTTKKPFAIHLNYPTVCVYLFCKRSIKFWCYELSSYEQRAIPAHFILNSIGWHYWMPRASHQKK